MKSLIALLDGLDDIMRLFHRLDGLFGAVSMPRCRHARRRLCRRP